MSPPPNPYESEKLSTPKLDSMTLFLRAALQVQYKKLGDFISRMDHVDSAIDNNNAVFTAVLKQVRLCNTLLEGLFGSQGIPAEIAEFDMSIPEKVFPHEKIPTQEQLRIFRTRKRPPKKGKKGKLRRTALSNAARSSYALSPLSSTSSSDPENNIPHHSKVSTNIESSRMIDLFGNKGTNTKEKFTHLTPSIGPDSDLSVPLFKGYCSFTMADLKSLDTCLSSDEIRLIQQVNPNFVPGWLTDTVIECYIRNLVTVHAPDDEACLVPCRVTVRMRAKHTLDKSILDRIWRAGDVKPMFTSDLLLFPYQTDSKDQWVLITLRKSTGMIWILDPMHTGKPPNSANYNAFIGKLGEVFKCEMKNVAYPPHVTQQDSMSCGVYICYYAELILSNYKSKHTDLTVPLNSYQYRRTIYENITRNITFSDTSSSPAAVRPAVTSKSTDGLQSSTEKYGSEKMELPSFASPHHYSRSDLEGIPSQANVHTNIKKLDLVSRVGDSVLGKTFTPPITPDMMLDLPLFRDETSDFSLTMVELKSLDPYISENEVKLLREIQPDFYPGWLVDLVIENYIHNLVTQYSPGINSCLIPCRIIQAMRRTTYPYNNAEYIVNVLKSEKNVNNIFNSDLLIFPYQTDAKNHWVLIVLCKSKSTIWLLDPMYTTKPRNVSGYMAFIRKLTVVFDCESAKVECPPHVTQKDVISCGVLICYYAEQFFRNYRSSSINLTVPLEPDIYRRTIYNNIIQNTTLAPAPNSQLCSRSQG